MPTTTRTWKSSRFSNFDADMSESSSEEEEEEEEEFVDDSAGYTDSIYAATPQYASNSGGFHFDPRLRGLTVSPSGSVGQTAVPVLNTVVNPVENLSNRIPMPTLSSPAESADVSGEGAARFVDDSGESGAPSDAECCAPYIPHFELRQTRENLGLNQAQRTRYGRSAGEGVSLSDDDERVSGTQGRFGPVATSDQLFTEQLYDQGFVSMSAVPAVYVGEFTDPITGQTAAAYESGMPPPDSDYEETLNSSGRNVKLAHLQGGWRDTTPRPTKTEHLEDDFHMTYDRSINSFGTYDPSYYTEVIQHNNRFSRDDHHPDADGPVLTGLPANVLGNQGDVKIRAMPYLPPTNRGKWAETTFRTGVDPGQQAAGGGSQRMDYEWTNTAYMRAESTRQDGGGMDGGQSYQGFMQQYGGAEGFDHVDTQRTTTAMVMPNMGPAQGHVQAQQVFGEVAAPNVSTGMLDSGMYAVGPAQSAEQGAALQNQIVPAPNAMSGLESVDEGGFGAVQYGHDGQKLMNARVDVQTSKSGLDVNTNATMGAGGDYRGTQLNKGVHGAQYKTNREQLVSVQAAFDTALGHNNAASSQAVRTRMTDKRGGQLVDFVMPGSTLGGTESMITHGTQNFGAVTNLSSKREQMYDSQFGVAPTGPDDPTVWMGDYRQTMEHSNVRPHGNFVHPNSGNAGMALGLRDDRESLSR